MRRRSETLKLSLLENGIDFIRMGIEQFFMRDTPDSRAHKYALLHLFAGVVLILKERLARAHPSLVFKAVEKMGVQDAVTVTFDETLNRLAVCAGVKLNRQDLDLLRGAQQTRNRLEHYAFELELKDTQRMVGQLSEFAYLFLRKELDTKLDERLPFEVVERIWDLRRIAEHLEEERREDWRQRAEKYSSLTDRELEELLAPTQYHPKDNPIPQQLWWCPECGQETLVTPQDDIGVCTNAECRDVTRVSHCPRCGNVIFDESFFCDNCQADIDGE